MRRLALVSRVLARSGCPLPHPFFSVRPTTDVPQEQQTQQQCDLPPHAHTCASGAGYQRLLPLRTRGNVSRRLCDRKCRPDGQRRGAAAVADLLAEALPPRAWSSRPPLEQPPERRARPRLATESHRRAIWRWTPPPAVGKIARPHWKRAWGTGAALALPAPRYRRWTRPIVGVWTVNMLICSPQLRQPRARLPPGGGRHPLMPRGNISCPTNGWHAPTSRHGTRQDCHTARETRSSAASCAASACQSSYTGLLR